MNQQLLFSDHLIQQPVPKGIDVSCKLQHFAIVTYAVPPERLIGLIHPRLHLDTVTLDGKQMALMSVVPFIDVDFTSAVFPFPKFRMGQTNYRIYVKDVLTGERCVWFLGTTLDSWTLVVPRYLWNLPWHAGKVEFDCNFDAVKNRYSSYRMNTESDWAPAHLELYQDGQDLTLPGFPDQETGLVFLTHPLAGFYFRRDGKLGTYRVWHDRLEVSPASLKSAYFGLLDNLGILEKNEQLKPHSVLVEPINEFTIYLPPKTLETGT